jgi:hypothetical protein
MLISRSHQNNTIIIGIFLKDNQKKLWFKTFLIKENLRALFIYLRNKYAHSIKKCISMKLVRSFPIIYIIISQYDLNGAVMRKVFSGIVIYTSSNKVFRSFAKNKT